MQKQVEQNTNKDSTGIELHSSDIIYKKYPMIDKLVNDASINELHGGWFESND